MIIVNQDKTSILNFNNIQDIRIEPYGTHIKGKKIYKIFAGNFEGYATELGTYAREERAKEVLKEIVNRNATYELYKTAPSGGKEQTEMLDMFAEKKYILDSYEMPEE